MRVSDKVEFLPTDSLKPDRNQLRKDFDVETLSYHLTENLAVLRY
jgi:hypothetical protein